MFDTILTALEPRLTEALAGILVVLFGIVTTMVRRAFAGVPDLIRQHLGVQAEKIWREAMHRALTSGALATEGIESEEERIDGILNYAWRSSPDALNALAGGKPDVLRDLARAKLRELGAAGALGSVTVKTGDFFPSGVSARALASLPSVTKDGARG